MSTALDSPRTDLIVRSIQRNCASCPCVVTFKVGSEEKALIHKRDVNQDSNIREIFKSALQSLDSEYLRTRYQGPFNVHVVITRRGEEVEELFYVTGRVPGIPTCQSLDDPSSIE